MEGRHLDVLDWQGKVENTGKYTADLAHQILAFSKGLDASSGQCSVSPLSPGPGGKRPDQKRLWPKTSLVAGEWLDGYDSDLKFNWCPVINSGRGRIGPRSKYKLLQGSGMADKMVKMERMTSFSSPGEDST